MFTLYNHVYIYLCLPTYYAYQVIAIFWLNMVINHVLLRVYGQLRFNGHPSTHECLVRKQADITISKNQALQVLYLVIIIYSVMIYSITVLNRNLPQISPVHKSRKVTVEIILKQLEYITKGHIAMYTIVL